MYPDLVTDVHLFEACLHHLLVVQVHVRLLQLEDGATQETVGFFDVPDFHFEGKFKSCVGLRKADHGLELSDSDSVRVVVALVLITDLNVVVSQQFGSLDSHLRLEFPCETNVELESLHVILGNDGSFLRSVHADDEVTEVLVSLFVGLVADNEEEIETRHDGCAKVDVVLE